MDKSPCFLAKRERKTDLIDVFLQSVPVSLGEKNASIIYSPG